MAVVHGGPGFLSTMPPTRSEGEDPPSRTGSVSLVRPAPGDRFVGTAPAVAVVVYVGPGRKVLPTPPEVTRGMPTRGGSPIARLTERR